MVGDLARKYDVSPMPVREALIRLEKEEFLEVIPHVGAKVTRFNERKLSELQQVRIELEAMASRLLAPIISDSDLKALDSLLEQGRLIVENGVVNEYFAWNEKFHLAIAGMNPNRTLLEYIESIWQKLTLLTTRIGAQEWRTGISFAEHQHWVSALRLRDPEEAERVCRQHGLAATDFTFDMLSLAQEQ